MEKIITIDQKGKNINDPGTKNIINWNDEELGGEIVLTVTVIYRKIRYTTNKDNGITYDAGTRKEMEAHHNDIADRLGFDTIEDENNNKQNEKENGTLLIIEETNENLGDSDHYARDIKNTGSLTKSLFHHLHGNNNNHINENTFKFGIDTNPSWKEDEELNNRKMGNE